MLYEGGVRSPLVVWAPGLIATDRAGSVNRTSVWAAIDLVPTLLAVAGVEPADGLTFDGEALPEVLLGRSQSSRSRPLFFRRPPDRPIGPAGEDLPDLAIRDGEWKLLCEYDGSEPQLYNLAEDRNETSNLATAQPERVQRLTARVLAWHASLPADNGAASEAGTAE
jgi:uncharacterized sulfatase